jgi:hypothetical protein
VANRRKLRKNLPPIDRNSVTPLRGWRKDEGRKENEINKRIKILLQ